MNLCTLLHTTAMFQKSRVAIITTSPPLLSVSLFLLLSPLYF